MGFPRLTQSWQITKFNQTTHSPTHAHNPPTQPHAHTLIHTPIDTHVHTNKRARDHTHTHTHASVHTHITYIAVPETKHCISIIQYYLKIYSLHSGTVTHTFVCHSAKFSQTGSLLLALDCFHQQSSLPKSPIQSPPSSQMNTLVVLDMAVCAA